MRRSLPRLLRSATTLGITVASAVVISACATGRAPDGSASGDGTGGTTASASARDALPTDGAALVRRMHDAYAGRWFRTLTFVQRTTFPASDGGADRVQTWYEATRAPGDLRIDIGDRASGDGMLFVRDSTFRFRAGRQVSARGEPNPLIPFVIALYHQPPEVTLRQLAPEGFDLARVHETTWDGRRAFVVGARDAADSLAPQFWVDAERLVLVRLIGRTGGATPRRLDVHMLRYEPLAGGWIAPYVEIHVDGRLAQKEKYSELRPNVELAPELFDPGQWTTAKWWR